jgi:hypothetical protein
MIFNSISGAGRGFVCLTDFSPTVGCFTDMTMKTVAADLVSVRRFFVDAESYKVRRSHRQSTNPIEETPCTPPANTR